MPASCGTRTGAQPFATAFGFTAGTSRAHAAPGRSRRSRRCPSSISSIAETENARCIQIGSSRVKDHPSFSSTRVAPQAQRQTHAPRNKNHRFITFSP